MLERQLVPAMVAWQPNWPAVPSFALNPRYRTNPTLSWGARDASVTPRVQEWGPQRVQTECIRTPPGGREHGH
jgi:hypothetical protein